MAARSNFADETLAVLVIYKLKPGESLTYQSLEKSLRLAGQKIDLLIYDNSPAIQDPPQSEYWITHYVNDPKNGGVSKAYNAGFDLAREKGKRWLWLLDQDDAFDDKAILTYDHEIKNHPAEQIFVPRISDEKSFLSPFSFRLGSGWRVPEIKPGAYPLHRFFFINSGTLISVEAFQRAGGFSEDLPLDFSDIDFTIRLRNSINQFVVIPASVKHELSSNSIETKEKKLARFRGYLIAGKVFRQKHKKFSRFVKLRAFFRACKLSVQYSSLQFMNEYRHQP